jgi:hypothetical protein
MFLSNQLVFIDLMARGSAQKNWIFADIRQNPVFPRRSACHLKHKVPKQKKPRNKLQGSLFELVTVLFVRWHQTLCKVYHFGDALIVQLSFFELSQYIR